MYIYMVYVKKILLLTAVQCGRRIKTFEALNTRVGQNLIHKLILIHLKNPKKEGKLAHITII